MFNILVTSPSRQYRCMDVLRKGFAEAGYGTIAAGNSNRIQGLYAADKAFIVPYIGESDYIPSLLEICQSHSVKAVFSLLDEDVLVISKAADEFKKLGVVPLMVDPVTAALCNDKVRFHEYLAERGFTCAKTCSSLEHFEIAYQDNEIVFPVFVKPTCSGYGTMGGGVCKNMDELKRKVMKNPQSIIQEYLDGPEYSIDVYMDIISGKMVSAFIKQMIAVHTGPSEKAISRLDERLFTMTEGLCRELGARGPLEVKATEADGRHYFNEVNPCLGSSYILSHAGGADFSRLITRNLDGIQNTVDVGNYSPGILMMKYDEVLLLRKEEVL